MCSEYSALVQNILSFFNYDVSYIFGERNNHPHAFNMIILNDEYYLLDSADGINCYKIDNKYLTTLPYLIPLEDFKDKDYQEFIAEEKELEVENYFSMIINNHYYAFPTDDNRNYKVLTKKI